MQNGLPADLIDSRPYVLRDLAGQGFHYRSGISIDECLRLAKCIGVSACPQASPPLAGSARRGVGRSLWAGDGGDRGVRGASGGMRGRPIVAAIIEKADTYMSTLLPSSRRISARSLTRCLKLSEGSIGVALAHLGRQARERQIVRRAGAIVKSGGSTGVEYRHMWTTWRPKRTLHRLVTALTERER